MYRKDAVLESTSYYHRRFLGNCQLGFEMCHFFSRFKRRSCLSRLACAGANTDVAKARSSAALKPVKGSKVGVCADPFSCNRAETNFACEGFGNCRAAMRICWKSLVTIVPPPCATIIARKRSRDRYRRGEIGVRLEGITHRAVRHQRRGGPVCSSPALSTVRSKYAAGCKPLLIHKTRGDPPRQTGGVIAVRST